MLSVEAIYDGKELKFNKRIKINSPHKVIVTFLDEPDEDITSSVVAEYAMKGGAFDFLNNPEEDIYSDADLKIR